MKKIQLAAGLLAASAAACLMLAPAAANAAQASIHLQPTVEIGLPPSVEPTALDWLLAVSCSQAGSCTAGGIYASFVGQAMVVTESGGRWRTPRPLLLPPEGSTIPPGQVNGISCTAPGNCVAAGVYWVGQGTTTGSRPFIAIQSHGTWGVARTIKLPKGADGAGAYSTLNSVSCPAPGTCYAVGVYQDHLGDKQAMRITESHGKWGQAVRLGQPVNVGKNPDAYMGKLSCTKAGTCVAVGSYADTGGNTQAVVFSRTGGKWHAGTEVKLPGDAATNPNALLAAASCPATGSCAAVGSYQNSQSVDVPIAMTVSAGKPSAARALKLIPAGAAVQPDSALVSVSCPAAGECVATGEYKTSAGRFTPMILTQAGGTWASTASIALPKDASTSVSRYAIARGVSCTGAGSCTVVGDYQSKTAGRSFAATTKP